MDYCQGAPWRFNPRPREGGDFVNGYFVTPHKSFNPRPREGGDAVVVAHRAKFTPFQSTPP